MTERDDFETLLERRLGAYAAAGARPADANVIARATFVAAALPVGRQASLRGPRRPTMLLGLAAVLLLATVAGAAFVGRWSPSIQGVFVDGPSLDEGRIVNAVALPDGRVLVGVMPEEGSVAGTTTLRCKAPCRPRLLMLDPRSGAFTPTHEVPGRLMVQSMALLHDGRVLVLRGSAESPDATGATIYDPVADRFEAVGARVEARDWPFVVTLADGRVLIGGGHAANAPLASAELFDPTTRTFSPAGAMAQPRGEGAGAVLLRDGRVLVAGGGPDLGASAELFDPASATFGPTGDMTEGRGGFFSSTLLPDGRVLFAGGVVGYATDDRADPRVIGTAEVYDPSTGRFAAVGPMAAPRVMHRGALLADGTVLVAAGAHDPGAVPVGAADAEIFDPTTGAFRPTGSLHRARLWPAVVSTDDRVLVLGDFDPAAADQDAASTSEWFE